MTDLLTLGGGTAAGFLMKLFAEGQKRRHEEFKLSMQRFHAIEGSRKSAAERVSNEAGKFTRRAIVISVLIGTVYVGFFSGWFDLPLIVETETSGFSLLWGLFEIPSRERFIELSRGWPVFADVKNSLLAIVGFYFGQGAAK
jgi:hypothetical protein